MKKGFTLIELLVVVLIMGILASFALPNYTKAVEKTRYNSLMPLAASVKNAEEAYYLADASYSADLEALDVSVPGEVAGNLATLEDGTQVQVNADGEHDYVKLSKDGLNNTYVMYFNKSSNYPGEIHCEALSDNERAKSLCENLGGEELGTGVTSGYTAYVLSGTGAGNATTSPSAPTPSPEPEPTPDPEPTPEPETPSYSTTPPSEGWNWFEEVNAWESLISTGGGGRIWGSVPEISNIEYPSDSQVNLTLADGSYLNITLRDGYNIDSVADTTQGSIIRFDAVGVLNGSDYTHSLEMEKHYGTHTGFWDWDLVN